MRARNSFAIVAMMLATVNGCGHEDQPEAEHPSSGAERTTKETPREESATQAERDLSGVSPEADGILRRMSKYLGSLQAFSFDATHTTDVVLDSGQKLAMTANSNVKVRRPDKLRSDRRGEKYDLSFFYDGRTVTLLGRQANAYAQAPAPPNLDAMIDFARDKLDLDAPGADLLYNNPYPVLTEDVVAGTRIGTAVVDGIRCHHLAYRGRQVDLQLWVEDGPRPLPHKYVITTKDVRSFPQYTVEMHNWNTSATLPDDVFVFVPPPEARRIEFLEIPEERRKTSAR